MRLPARALALAAALAPVAAPAAVDDDWTLLPGIGTDRPFAAGEVPEHPAPGGLALTLADGHWRLAPAVLEATVTERDAEGRPSRVTIAATPRDAVAYLRLPGLRPGKVDTPDVRLDGGMPDLHAAVTLPFKGKPWRFEPRGNAVWLTDGRRRQRIEDFGAPDRVGNSAGVQLAWAGDLDRDGRLDFVIVVSTEDGSTTCAWLSGKARRGQLAGKAACVDRLAMY